MSEQEIIALTIFCYMLISFCLVLLMVRRGNRNKGECVLILNIILFVSFAIFMIYLYNLTLSYNKEQNDKQMICKRINYKYYSSTPNGLIYYEQYSVDGISGARGQVSNFSSIASLKVEVFKTCEKNVTYFNDCISHRDIIPCWLQNVDGKVVLLTFPDRHRPILEDIVFAILFCSLYLLSFIKIYVDTDYQDNSCLCNPIKYCLQMINNERREGDEIIVLPQPFFSVECVTVKESVIYETNCAICHDSLTSKSFTNNIIITDCKHLFCKGCIKQWKESEQNMRNIHQLNNITCPLCRTAINQVYTIEVENSVNSMNENVENVEIVVE